MPTGLKMGKSGFYLGAYMNNEESIYLGLVKVLSELSVLRQKLLNYHWNVTGVNFYEKHLLFERLYKSVDGFIDRIAEQSRAYGRAPGTFRVYLSLSSITEDSEIPSTDNLIPNLINDFTQLRSSVYSASVSSEDIKDLGVENLLGDISESINTALYLLKSTNG